MLSWQNKTLFPECRPAARGEVEQEPRRSSHVIVLIVEASRFMSTGLDAKSKLRKYTSLYSAY
ncbi:hypothetical protein EYF80_044482 [Liparis tanakae]|uniref:Uncharacterized protein n=1 Tax=Liparis tanakae TaxID=230148 RepID=A0A4Z2FWP6_9TELE|nr:hypothetical protein EYF80_044482 [Liparis tanakae]